MRASRHFLRNGSLAAILAVLLNALWPLLAQVTPADSTLVAVCSESGTRYIELQNDAPLGKPLAAHHRHCKLCVLGCDRVVVPALPAPLALPIDSALPRVAAFAAVPPAVHSAIPASPRAPPFAS